MKILVFALMAVGSIALYGLAQSSGGAVSRTEGVAAFEAIVPALRHPRCMVCHSSGDYPRQGDDLHRHTMAARRGQYGVGTAPVYCSSCHQDHNLAGVNAPPGAPGWHLPPADNPLVWEGLSDSQLCRLLTDTQHNGGRDAKALEEHMHTPLVLWGWHPGEGRQAESMPEEVFLRNVHTWTATGAPCPGT